MSSILLAILSAFFAGITAILCKIGIKNTDSNLATALRTIIVLFFAFIMVCVTGSLFQITKISPQSLIFIILSGLSTGASWICYFKALQIGKVNKVAPIDKLSGVLTIIFAMTFLGEEVTVYKILSVILIAVGTLLITVKFKKRQPQKLENLVQKGATQNDNNIENGIIIDKSAEENFATNNDSSFNNSDNSFKLNTNINNKNITTYLWVILALLSAVFASLSAIFAKVGIEDVDSYLATFIRTIVVLIMAWLIVFATKKHKDIKKIDKKSWLFIALSGIATGASWICFYLALKLGQTSIVVSIDKLSILVTIVFSYFVFKEKLSIWSVLGLVLIVGGTLILLI